MNYAKCLSCGWVAKQGRMAKLQADAEDHVLDHPLCKAVAMTDGEGESLMMQYGVEVGDL